MGQDLGHVDERPQERHLAGVDEVAVTDRALQARPSGDVASDERVDGIDSEAAVLEQMQQRADTSAGVRRISLHRGRRSGR